MTKEFQPFEVITPNDKIMAEVPLVFVVDHASAHIPNEYNGLGLDKKILDTHVAIDIGAKQMALRLVEQLGGRAVLANFSRLLIDPNRELWRENLIPMVTDGIRVKGNENLTDDQKAERINKFYSPFHGGVEKEVCAFLAKGLNPLVVGVHSFTPQMGNEKRPWHIGFMWNEDARLGLGLAKAFEKMGKTVGHNLPYGGDDLFHTMMTHGFAHGLPHSQIEVRQDLVGRDRGANEWADMIAEALSPFIENPKALGRY